MYVTALENKLSFFKRLSLIGIRVGKLPLINNCLVT